MPNNVNTFDQNILYDNLKDYSTDDVINISSTPVLSTGISTTSIYTIGSNGTSAVDWSNTSITGGIGANIWTTNTPATIGAGGTMELQGKNADIKINGRSLMSAIDALEQRLNILVPNPELEKEWDELRELGERYRELEKKCKEKGEMWKKLKSMPPPETD